MYVYSTAMPSHDNYQYPAYLLDSSNAYSNNMLLNKQDADSVQFKSSQSTAKICLSL